MMQGKPSTFWGKLKREGDTVTAWHPLIDHCADVAACCEAILKCSLMKKRLAALAGLPKLTPVQLARLCVLAALHDIGKFNRGFQNKARERQPFTSGHVNEALVPLFGGNAHDAGRSLFEALSIEEILSWGERETMCQLLMASVSHHGKPGKVGGDIHKDAWRVSDGIDPFVGVRDLSRRVRAWFPEASEAGGDPLPSDPAFHHAFSGLVMLADWLGSDSRAEMFPYSEDGAEDRIAFARERAMHAACWIGLDPKGPRRALGDATPGFERISKYPPNSHQRALARAPVSDRGSVVILEAETGSGKTEAALAHYLRLFHAKRVDGMYFALPTRTAATQIHRRVTKALMRAFRRKASRPVTVLAVPGYIVVDDATAKKRLPGFEVLWNESDAERYRYRGWAAENPKRYLAGAAAIGTVDQVLFSALTVGHAHLRATALLRQLLVVDEVHASDVYMTTILEEVLKRHVAAGGHALLMSATLGAAAKQRLLKACGDRSRLPSLEDAIRLPYPSIAVQTPGSAPEFVPIERSDEEADRSHGKDVRIELAPSIDDPEAIARRALDMARAGARVLVLRNTVKGCLAVQRALERLAEQSSCSNLLFQCNRIPAPHHSRYAKDDREALDKAIERRFGKKSQSGGCVAVATQTVQQSLDLDADVMITDLCPMDVLLQRIGRLFRHDREGQRPLGFESALLVVLVPENRDLTTRIRKQGRVTSLQGLGSVYEDLRVIEATWRLLEEHDVLGIPSMNRKLVERATHPEALARIAPPGDEAWQGHERLVIGASAAQRVQAHLNLFDWKTPFDETTFPSGQIDRRIASRLETDDRRIVFAEPLDGPFGKPVRELSMPRWWVADAVAEAAPQVTLREPACVEFEFGGRRFRYDRLGLNQIIK
jgi:CRISPR-associated endonuclease/helicase Cas3